MAVFLFTWRDSVSVAEGFYSANFGKIVFSMAMLQSVFRCVITSPAALSCGFLAGQECVSVAEQSLWMPWGTLPKHRALPSLEH